MPGTGRCDEIIRLIDAVLDEPSPTAAAPAPEPPAAYAAARQPADGTPHRWRPRLHRPSHGDARYVAPPAAAPAGPVRFHPSLHTAGELVGGRRRPAALPEAG